MTSAALRPSEQIFRARLSHVQRTTNQVFFWLLLAQWALAIVLSLTVSPYAWEGRERTLHIHVHTAVVFGALLNALPLTLIRQRPDSFFTRQVVGLVQMLWGAVLIDLTGGRIETHFHVFGSLAFLAFYRSMDVLITATLVVVTDHLLRGLYAPEAIYGLANPEWWRFLEHAAWVSFELIVLAIGTSRARRDMQLLAEREVALEQANTQVEEKVALRTRQLGESLERYRALVENTNAIPWELDPQTGKLLYIAPQAARFFGVSIDELHNSRFSDLLHPDDRDQMVGYMRLALEGKATDGDSVDYRMVTGDGRLIHVRSTVSSYQKGDSLRGITIDITKQVKLEGELRQAQKLESIGKLAAGVAHEINTPVQFVSDSVHFVKGAFTDLSALLGSYGQLSRAVRDGAPAAAQADESERTADEINLPYLNEQVPRALDLALDGLGRVAEIVRSMREFAYPHKADMLSVDLNQAIRSTLTIARSEYKYVAELETDLGDLPRVTCRVGDINQVVLNLVVNAAHAIAAKNDGTKGTITVRTRQEGDDVVIAIRDTGCGIPEHVRDRIFDPFFTTKDVGRGTGQGLAISRTVVVDRHKGALWFDSQVGEGTTFYVRLPIDGAHEAEKSAA